MSQSRFSIVLVGVSALLRRPLVSRLRPADGERSPWVVFAARRCLPFRRLPLGGLTFGLTASAFRHAPLRGCPRRVGSSAFRFGVAARQVGASAFRFGVAARRVGLRAHGFRFSARTASGLPSSGWRFRSAGWPSGSPLPLFGMRRFGVALGGLAFGLTASAFRHAPIRTAAPPTRGPGAHRHDTCFTSKHLSQHVNLPHRSP